MLDLNTASTPASTGSPTSEPVGIYEVADRCLVRYGPIDLGLLDPSQFRLRVPRRRARPWRTDNGS